VVLTGEFLSIVAFDRSGVVASRPINIHQEPALFLHIIVGCLFLDVYEFGLDPTVHPELVGEIEVDGEWFDIVDIIHVEGGLCGRGTVCYYVRKDGVYYIIKDRWVVVGKGDKEAKILKSLEGLKHIPTVIKDVPVMFNGKKDTTEFLRQSKNARDVHVEIREHRRMLLQPCAHSLSNFRDLVELLTAIRDVVNGE
ncbi:hypothetical protein SCHPADRAFT_788180, partial [Schizopora paradoxa]